ncbi:ATP-binding protein [Marinobacter sp.]|uniref:ATP-binding protein n=1 Tax=Marinobacter sp. TaxID=50741 RepID=UPI0038507CE6
MSLKRQLLLASLLMLLIPWAGLQFVLELDEALRTQALEQLRAQANRMSETLATSLPPAADNREVIYASTLARPLNLDGYGDDWPDYDDESLNPEPENASWQLAADRFNLYLLLRVVSPSPEYFDPGEPAKPHEHVRLYWSEGDSIRERDIRTPAPGPVVGWRPGRRPEADYGIRGVWQATGRGYQLEIQLPRPDEGEGFGFQVHRPQPQPGNTATGTIPVAGIGSPAELPRLIARIPELESQLAQAMVPGQQALVLNRQGWVLAKPAVPAEDRRPAFETLGPMEIIEQISLNGLRALVSHFQPSPLRLPEVTDRLDPAALAGGAIVRHGGGPAHLMTWQQLDDGRHLVLEQSLEQILALSGDALGTVISRTSLLILALILALLGYASWLSWRITRLRQAVRASIDEDGRVLGPMAPGWARDELGELSRQFSQMVDNLQGYTRYLESFSRRLSHELKTPVAVVRSSLENLSQGVDPASREAYIQRAHQATDRLSQILQGMSEAARLEQSFDNAEKEAFDLAVVVSQTTEAYQALSPDHRIHYLGPESGITVHGSPELIVQLLDKLVDNARDFTPKGGRIELRVKPLGEQVELAVFNEGSSLPSHLTSEIFSPFVSLRGGTDQGHLGQGLLIVRLIAEHHQGSVQAENLAAENGVIFRVRLPRVAPD